MAKSDLCAEKQDLPIGCSDVIQGVIDVAGCIPVVGDAAQAAVCKTVAGAGNVLLRTMSGLVPMMCQLPEMLEKLKGLMEKENPKMPKRAVKKTKHMKAFSSTMKGKVKTGAKKAKGGSSSKKKIKREKTTQKAACVNGKCFTGDTLVLTKFGLCPIKQIQKGDDIYSRNEHTGETGYRKVEDVFQTEAHTIYRIWLNGEQEVKTTAYHPFFVKNRGWVTAIKLRKDDLIETMEGDVPITGITKVRQEEPVIVYNFHVEEWSSYFVTEYKIYVHNSEGEHAEKPYRVSETRREHILVGNPPKDPGHGPNRGYTRGAFPDSMTDDEAIAAIEDVANNPNLMWKRQSKDGNVTAFRGGPNPNEPAFTISGRSSRYQIEGESHGQYIRVIVEPGGEGIITGFIPDKKG